MNWSIRHVRLKAMLTKDKYESDFLKCLEFFDKSYYHLTVLKGKDSFLNKFLKKSKKKDQPHEDEVWSCSKNLVRCFDNFQFYFKNSIGFAETICQRAESAP